MLADDGHRVLTELMHVARAANESGWQNDAASHRASIGITSGHSVLHALVEICPQLALMKRTQVSRWPSMVPYMSTSHSCM